MAIVTMTTSTSVREQTAKQLHRAAERQDGDGWNRVAS